MKCFNCVIACLLFTLPLYAQKNLLPAARAALGKTAKGVLAGTVQEGAATALTKILPVRAAWPAGRMPARLLTPRPQKLPDITGPLTYLSPGKLNEEVLDKLSALIPRQVQLLHPSNGTKRSLSELASFVENPSAPAVVQAQALALLLQNWTEPEARLFLSVYPFLTKNNAFCIENNSMLLKLLPMFQKQVQTVKQQRETILGALQMEHFGGTEHLLRQIPPKRRLIMLGEVHNRRAIAPQVADLLRAYHRAYPGRKIVLFSEFLSNRYPARWRPGEPIPADFFEKEPQYSNCIYQLGKELNMDIYGLENLRYTYLQVPKESGLSFAVANTTFRAMTARNKAWVKIIRPVMQKTLQQYPDAVFFVYAGTAHTDKTVFPSVAFLLQKENPYCISIRNGFQSGFLGLLLGKDPDWLAELPDPQLWTWKEGKDSSGLAGFDAQLVLPFDEQDSVPLDK